MLLSVIQRLDSIENDLLKRMIAVEQSVENAHYRVSELEHQITSLQCQFEEMQTTRKDENIIQGYRLRNLDHSLIFLELDLKFCTDFPSSIKCWDYSRADFKKLNEILLTAPWENIIAASPTPDAALTNTTDISNQSACTCIPFRILESKKSTSVDAKPWINLTLKKMIHKRRRLFAKWRRTQCHHHRLAYNCLRNKIQRYIKDRKNQYNQFVLSKLDSLSTS